MGDAGGSELDTTTLFKVINRQTARRAGAARRRVQTTEEGAKRGPDEGPRRVEGGEGVALAVSLVVQTHPPPDTLLAGGLAPDTLCPPGYEFPLCCHPGDRGFGDQVGRVAALLGAAGALEEATWERDILALGSPGAREHGDALLFTLVFRAALRALWAGLSRRREGFFVLDPSGASLLALVWDGGPVALHWARGGRGPERRAARALLDSLHSRPVLGGAAPKLLAPRPFPGASVAPPAVHVSRFRRAFCLRGLLLPSQVWALARLLASRSVAADIVPTYIAPSCLMQRSGLVSRGKGGVYSALCVRDGDVFSL